MRVYEHMMTGLDVKRLLAPKATLWERIVARVGGWF